MILTLKRDTLTPATLGRLFIDGVPECDSLERPWLDNRRQVSAIPVGTYPVTMRYSDRFRRIMLHVEAVPGRDGILIHPANTVDELQGCIALGKCLHTDQLFDSRLAVARVEGKVRGAIARGEPITLTISNPEVVA